jgi:tetratricopeptide (TPR) repeat protein
MCGGAQCYTGKVKRDKRKAGKLAATKSPRPPFDRRHLLAGAAVLIALFAYANSFQAPFLLDNSEIVNDTRLRAATADNVERILDGPYHQAILSGLYRPLTTLSYLYNYAVLGNGTNPAGYHWLNFLVHAANILLVYALGWIVFQHIPAALALAALWGVHPVLTEGVTNIVGRADMLAAFGALASVVAYHHALRAHGLVRVSLLAAIALATAIGSFSKESGIVAIAVLAVYDLMFESNRPWRERLSGWLAAAIPVAAFLAVRARVVESLPAGPFPFTDNPIVGAGFVEGRMTAFKVIGKYLGLLVWPAKLSPDYSYNEIPVAIDFAGIASLLICVSAGALAIWSWRRAKALSFAILFFFVALAPVSNVFVTIGSIMGERFLYLPSVGFVAAVVYGLMRAWEAVPQHRKVLAGSVGVVVLAFACRSIVRNADWGDEQRFWRSAQRAVPGSFKMRITAAGALPRPTPQAWQRAIGDAEQALALLDPLPDDRNSGYGYRSAGTLYRLYGDQLQSAGDAAGAEQWRRRSLDALLRAERIERKLDETYRAINGPRGIRQSTFLPSSVYRELGITYLSLSDFPHAVETLERGRNLESDPELLENLAVAYGSTGELRKAALALVEELAVDSRRSYLSEKLAAIYQEIDPKGCAVEGGSLNFACPIVHDDICAASKNVVQNYARRNQMAAAESVRRVATEDLGCAVWSVF